jgi:hypothetical protein
MSKIRSPFFIAITIEREPMSSRGLADVVLEHCNIEGRLERNSSHPGSSGSSSSRMNNAAPRRSPLRIEDESPDSYSSSDTLSL